MEIITCGQQAGFSLEEMRKLTSASGDGAARHDLLLASLKRKVAEIEAMQLRLAQNRAQLLAVIAGMQGKPQGMDCDENAQRLIAGWQEGELPTVIK
nr:MerR family DNA-binding protein [Pseudomonas sp. CC120222-01a]